MPGVARPIAALTSLVSFGTRAVPRPWYLVAQNDEALPPDAQRQLAARMGATIVEIPSSHVALVSHPQEVAELIGTAAAAGRSRLSSEH
jgi:hypothetical protein